MTVAHEEVRLLEPVDRVKTSARTVRTKVGLGAVDAGVSIVAFAIASALMESGSDRLAAVAVFLVSGGIWLGRGRLYSSRFITRRADEVRRIIDAVALTAATVAVVAFAFDLDVERWWIGSSAGFAACAGCWRRSWWSTPRWS